MEPRTRHLVREELEAEREKLEDAVNTLRGQAVRASRKVPLVVGGVAALGVLIAFARRRVSRRRPLETRGRGRIPFR